LQGAFTGDDLLAAGDVGADACGNESSIQTLQPLPGNVTDGFARTTGLACADEAGQIENPLPGKLTAGEAWAEPASIHKLWPSPGN